MITDLKSAIKVDDYEKIKSLSKTLQETLMSIGKKVYSSQTNSSSPESKSANDTVIDADFSETK
jgi:hypothetical protein